MLLIIQSLLIFWFCVDIYLIKNNILISHSKIGRFLVDLLMLGFIVANLAEQDNGVLYFLLGFIGICWYVYNTPLDFTDPNVPRIQQVSIGIIDLIILGYIVESLLDNKVIDIV